MCCRKRLEEAAGELKFGNALYQIRFEQIDEFPMFGHRYWFQLEDAIDDLPEFLVDFDTLTRYSYSQTINMCLNVIIKESYGELWRVKDIDWPRSTI